MMTRAGATGAGRPGLKLQSRQHAGAGQLRDRPRYRSTAAARTDRPTTCQRPGTKRSFASWPTAAQPCGAGRGRPGRASGATNCRHADQRERARRQRTHMLGPHAARAEATPAPAN